jgi:hypothetical protein
MTIRNLWTGQVGPNLSKEFLTNSWFRYYCQLASSYSFKSMASTQRSRNLYYGNSCFWHCLASCQLPGPEWEIVFILCLILLSKRAVYCSFSWSHTLIEQTVGKFETKNGIFCVVDILARRICLFLGAAWA